MDSKTCMQQIGKGEIGRLYLLYGPERYLVEQTVEQIRRRLIPEATVLFDSEDLQGAGLTVSELYIPETKHTDIRYADFKIRINGDITGVFNDFISQEQIITVKKTKRGEKEIDLKPDIGVLRCETEEGGTVWIPGLWRLIRISSGKLSRKTRLIRHFMNMTAVFSVRKRISATVSRRS